MITIKEYASRWNISYEAVRKQVKKYRGKELYGHVGKIGNATAIDDYAVRFLDERRNSNLHIIEKDPEQEQEITEVKEENTELIEKLKSMSDLLKEKSEQIDSLKDELLTQQRTIIDLQSKIIEMQTVVPEVVPEDGKEESEEVETAGDADAESTAADLEEKQGFFRRIFSFMQHSGK